jgi:hypothetical protein
MLNRLKCNCGTYTSSEAEVVIKKLQTYKSPGTDQIPAKLLAEGATIRSDIHKLINYVRNTKALPRQRKKSLIPLIYKKGDKRDCNNYRVP